MMVSTLLLAGVAQFVNPMIGTGNRENTCPGPVWPIGLVQPVPDTSLVTKPMQGFVLRNADIMASGELVFEMCAK